VVIKCDRAHINYGDKMWPCTH